MRDAEDIGPEMREQERELYGSKDDGRYKCGEERRKRTGSLVIDAEHIIAAGTLDGLGKKLYVKGRGRTKREARLPSSARALLGLLASYADEHGVCFASVRKLAEGLGLTRRQTQNLLEELRLRELIYRVEHPPVHAHPYLAEKAKEARGRYQKTAWTLLNLGDRTPVTLRRAFKRQQEGEADRTWAEQAAHWRRKRLRRRGETRSPKRAKRASHKETISRDHRNRPVKQILRRACGTSRGYLKAKKAERKKEARERRREQLSHGTWRVACQSPFPLPEWLKRRMERAGILSIFLSAPPTWRAWRDRYERRGNFKLLRACVHAVCCCVNGETKRQVVFRGLLATGDLDIRDAIMAVEKDENGTWTRRFRAEDRELEDEIVAGANATVSEELEEPEGPEET